MDELRWILLLVGAVVVVAIYWSSRFENEDWAEERKQFAQDKKGRSEKKPRRKKIPLKQSPVVARELVKKEPSMGAVKPTVEKPAVSELVIDVAVPDESEAEITELKMVPTEFVAPEKGVSEKVTLEKKVVPEEIGPEEVVLETIVASEIVPQEKETPHNEITNDESVEDVIEEIPIEKIIEPGIEDEITEIEIPVDLTVAEAEIHVADIVEDEEAEQSEVSLDIEPLVLSVIVLADEEEVFSGPEIKEALEAEDLHHGAMSIFHFHDPGKNEISESDDAVFSVANVLEPGLFDVDNLDEIQTPGLMLFCQLPGPLAGEAALEIMLDKGRGLAVRLHGHMCDDKRNRFTVQAKNHYLDRIATFSREVALARSKVPAS